MLVAAIIGEREEDFEGTRDEGGGMEERWCYHWNGEEIGGHRSEDGEAGRREEVREGFRQLQVRYKLREVIEIERKGLGRLFKYRYTGPMG